MADAAPEKSRGLTFAEQQMLRHGWQPGKGLGRNEDGMSEPIKVKVKCDKGGVGHKLGEQFTFNWWDHVFNKASSNLAVESDKEGIVVKKVNSEEEVGMISNKRPRKAVLTKGKEYGCFVKSATLVCGQEQPERVSSSSDDSSDSEDENRKLDLSSAANLSDAELLKVCGGRTAHKGARHGLTMSAKLARLEQQEQEFLAKYAKKAAPEGPSTQPKAASASPCSGNDHDTADGGLKKAKRKKDKRKRAAEESVDIITNGDVPEVTDVPDSGEQDRKKKKKKRSKEQVEKDAGETHTETVKDLRSEAPEDLNTADSKAEKKKKKKQARQQEANSNIEGLIDTGSSASKELSANGEHGSTKEIQKLSKKKSSKRSSSNGTANHSATSVNGHVNIANECEADDVTVEDCCRNQQTSTDAEVKKTKKKKKKKSSKEKVDSPSVQEEEIQNNKLSIDETDLRAGAEETAVVKRKSKKRKTCERTLDENVVKLSKKKSNTRKQVESDW